MLKIKKILGLVLLFNFYSCKQDTTKKDVHECNEKVIEISENEKSDSLNLVLILKKTLVIAKQHISKENYQTELRSTPNNDSEAVITKLKIGNFFSNTQRHLIVKTKSQSTIYVNIFLIKNKTFFPVLNHKELEIEYEKDSILDVDNDGFKDYLTLGHASSGCCLKNFAIVYLFQTDKTEFSRNFTFVNPTFAPKEKIIRGICYGQSGETAMYKFNWNKQNIDTLEYISFEKDKEGIKTGNIIKSKKQDYKKADGKFIKLSEVPKEYLSIDGYEWFKGQN